MIYNKSGHPVEVKKISIRLWSLRDEIEAALERRMKECEAAGEPLYIDDIREFYHFATDHRDNVVPLNRENEASFMESLGDEVKGIEAEAEELIAKQTEEGLETHKPSQILNRPFERQAPDLDKISYGFSLLSDVNMDTILSFTKEKFLNGQSIVVEFLIPKPFRMMAEVTYCHHYAMRSRIISSTRPDYRVQCKFTYELKDERTNLREFLKSISPTTGEKKKLKKESEDDSLGL